MLSVTAQDKRQVMKIWHNGQYSTYTINEIDSITFCEEEPPQNITVEESYQIKADEAMAMMYKYVTDAHNQSEEMIMMRLSNDLYYENQLSPKGAVVANVFQQYYRSINVCNTLLENVNDEECQAHAKLLRAFCYSRLVLLFGDVPYVTTTEVEEGANIQRMSKDFVLKACIEDVENNLNYTRRQTRSIDFSNKSYMMMDDALMLLSELKLMAGFKESIILSDQYGANWTNIYCDKNLVIIKKENDCQTSNDYRQLLLQIKDWSLCYDTYWLMLTHAGEQFPVLYEEVFGKTQEYKKLFPIPYSELLYNPQFVQNPGYELGSGYEHTR